MVTNDNINIIIGVGDFFASLLRIVVDYCSFCMKNMAICVETDGRASALAPTAFSCDCFAQSCNKCGY